MPAPIPFSFHEFDLDGARAAIAQSYFPTTLDLCTAAAPYEFRFVGHAHSPLTVGDAHYTSGMKIGIEEVGSVYINIATGGTLLARHRGQVVQVDPSRGVVFQATGDVAMTTGDDYSCLAVKVAPGALEGALEVILGRPVTQPLALGPMIDLRSGAGAGWARLVRLLVAEAGPGGVASSEMVAAPLREAVLHGLLRAVDHPYRDALDAPAPSFGPAALRRVVDAVEADPTRDLTLTDMARIAAVSVRTLQELYRRHLDTTPTEHVRRARLARAHDQLRSSDPTETTVSAVARRWGFVHIGRFARTYRTRYGELPSATLRRTD
ncbi:AraC family transcriptional regulator [Pseudonocardia sp. KRD-184]|uniref:AraC family transcriptional regulator n=1 Tax=Pseudonocardia oceani TaxID=2792013 RepID=A0ABS6UHT5_9PSEU|nr:AraC family transcriptional regulator [Pseudonocardia oceani]MBW0088769.1 AraC family transcriptional regulator [Pseudonocardia oceani]MBW0096368.1 AraC family transcriptional regulator [Pseudonocardia oceani]MBW0107339.1 AraC family transcriptional regulator [Pseudonocardia oceani]MBW0122436.1 AraC family transcriptional regulator [Pseudonocardia oceani]MBW0131471.1 AraC family transcriptional regulator [Pseudonocardia oceani]